MGSGVVVLVAVVWITVTIIVIISSTVSINFRVIKACYMCIMLVSLCGILIFCTVGLLLPPCSVHHLIDDIIII